MKRIKGIIKDPRVLIILLVCLITTNALTIAYFKWDERANNPVAKYPLIDIAREFIPQEHFIVNIQPLRENLYKIAEESGTDNTSIYFEFLNTGANIQIGNETRFYPASLVKLPTALVVMKKIERGEWQNDDRLVLLDEDKDSRFGNLYEQEIGTSFTIESLLTHLLVESDNTAHKILMRNLNSTELDELQEAIGLQELFNEKNEISAKEYSRMFRALYNSSFLSRAGSQQILELLAQTNFNDGAAKGVEQGIKYSHKIGEDEIEKNFLDSGIVYLPNRPYLLTIMIKNKDEAQAQALMQKISEQAFNYVKSYEQK